MDAMKKKMDKIMRVAGGVRPFPRRIPWLGSKWCEVFWLLPDGAFPEILPLRTLKRGDEAKS